MKNQTYISRGKKPYQQYQFRCIIPNDLEETFSTKEFRLSLKSSLYSQSKIISTNLYNLSQFIFREVREGKMKDITLEDVKNILRVEVRKSLLHIHHYELVFCFRWNWKNLLHELVTFRLCNYAAILILFFLDLFSLASSSFLSLC